MYRVHMVTVSSNLLLFADDTKMSSISHWYRQSLQDDLKYGVKIGIFISMDVVIYVISKLRQVYEQQESHDLGVLLSADLNWSDHYDLFLKRV